MGVLSEPQEASTRGPGAPTTGPHWYTAPDGRPAGTSSLGVVAHCAAAAGTPQNLGPPMARQWFHRRSTSTMQTDQTELH